MDVLISHQKRTLREEGICLSGNFSGNPVFCLLLLKWFSRTNLAKCIMFALFPWEHTLLQLSL